MHPSTLPGGITLNMIHSLNGLGDLGDLGVILNRSGNYINPLYWRDGIQGLDMGMLQTWPGSGGSDPLVRNPIHPQADPGLYGLGSGLGETLTPGINGLSGLMQFPGTGGSDPLVRNQIHPADAHAWYVGAAQLGDKNKLADSLQAPTPADATSSGVYAVSDVSSATSELSQAINVGALAHILGLAGIVKRGHGGISGLGCSCGCGGGDGCSENSSSTPGLGDIGTSISNTLDQVFLSTGLDFSWSGSLFGGIPNYVWYAGGGALLLGNLLLQPKYAVSVRRRRNPAGKRRKRSKR